MYTDTERYALEELVDAFGFDNIVTRRDVALDLLAEICAEKAEHIRMNWQDEGLAQQWDAKAARAIDLEAYAHDAP